MDNLTEEWMPIPGFNGRYDVSSHGRVRRNAYASRTDHRGISKQISAKEMPVTMNNGYRVVRVTDESGSGSKCYIDPLMQDLFGIQRKTDDVASLDGEEWRPITNFPGYEVSNLGRVRSRTRLIKRRGRLLYLRGRLMHTTIPNHGYMKTELSAQGSIKTLLIHRLVADAFVANPLGLDVVHHIDENRMNNRDSNLEWTTRGGNVQDRFDRRRIVVSVETIETIIAASRSGKTPAEILAALPKKRKGK